MAPVLIVNVQAQDASGMGELNFQTHLGSFRIIRFNEKAPAIGRLEITFSGTVLVSGYEGKPIEPTIKGNIRREFPDPKVLPSLANHREKVVYHGTGSMVIDGKYMFIQWFGRNMKAKWVGAGVIRLIGEFDDKLETGTYYFKDPAKINWWPTSVSEIHLPQDMYGRFGPTVKPVMPKAPPKPKSGGGG